MKQEGLTRVDKNQIIYRASGIGSCIRALVASRLGIPDQPRPKPIQDAMDASTTAEPVALIQLREDGWTTDDEQEEVDWTLIRPEGQYVVRGHIDATGTHPKFPDLKFVIEVKNMSDGMFSKYVRRGTAGWGALGLQYDWQISAYMHATQLAGLLVVRNKKPNPDGSHDMHLTVIAEPPISEAQLESRIMEVERAVAREWYPECDRKCTSFSPYAQVHHFAAAKQDTIDDPELVEAMEMYAQAKAQIKQLTELLEGTKEEPGGLRAEIEPHLQAGTEYVAGRARAKLIAVNGTRFDQSAFKKAHPDLYDEFVVPSNYTRLTLELVEEEGQ